MREDRDRDNQADNERNRTKRLQVVQIEKRVNEAHRNIEDGAQVDLRIGAFQYLREQNRRRK